MTDTEKAIKISIEIAQKYDSKDVVGYECAMKMAEYKNEKIEELEEWIKLLEQRIELFEQNIELQ